jgi:hypothetical protein
MQNISVTKQQISEENDNLMKYKHFPQNNFFKFSVHLIKHQIMKTCDDVDI